MKCLWIAALTLVSGLSFADNCKQYESQVFAKVVEVDDLPRPDTPVCETKLKLTQVQEHALCPIGVSEGSEVIVYLFKTSSTCYQVGDEVSGILVKDQKGSLSLE